MGRSQWDTRLLSLRVHGIISSPVGSGCPSRAITLRFDISCSRTRTGAIGKEGPREAGEFDKRGCSFFATGDKSIFRVIATSKGDVHRPLDHRWWHHPTSSLGIREPAGRGNNPSTDLCVSSAERPRPNRSQGPQRRKGAPTEVRNPKPKPGVTTASSLAQGKTRKAPKSRPCVQLATEHHTLSYSHQSSLLRPQGAGSRSQKHLARRASTLASGTRDSEDRGLCFAVSYGATLHQTLL